MYAMYGGRSNSKFYVCYAGFRVILLLHVSIKAKDSLEVDIALTRWIIT